MKKVREIMSCIIKLLYPLRCPVCDDVVKPWNQNICEKCVSKLSIITSPYCFKCGKKMENEEDEYCYDCRNKTHFYIRGRALYEYKSVAASIYRFKYQNRQEYADFYGQEIACHLGDFIRQVQPDGLVPVPLHRKKSLRRGYNQSLLLAQGISKYINIPVYGKMLKRVKNTVPLKHLNPTERQKKLKKAFIINGNDVKLNTIIVIDDIYTTGSTIDEVTRVLLDGGTKNVFFITLSCGTGM